jgi:DNA-binding SARP family transcriptional activator
VSNVKQLSKRQRYIWRVLRARLLGALEVELNGAVIDSPASQRPWAVFAYVALSPRPVPRAELANRFWPDVLDQSARASLRSVLWSLRRSLPDALAVDVEKVSLPDCGEVWVDVREFERLAPGSPEAALELCAGELLEGVEDEWALLARARHRERVIELLEQLALRELRSGDVRAAIDLTRRQVDLDPLDEEAHRRLIERLAGAGERSAALRAYRALGERLRRELGVAPAPATRALLEDLRVEPARVVPAGATPAPAPLVGREEELAALRSAWTTAASGDGVAAVVRGEAGIGKSRLAAELVHAAQDGSARCAICAGLDLGGLAPLSLWAELARSLLPTLPAPPAEASWPEELLALAGELPPHFERTAARAGAVAPDLQRTRLFEAIVAMLAWAAHDAPLLLVVEDAHAADGPSLELAAYAARRIAQMPVMMLVTRRELPHSVGADRLEQALRAPGLLACELDLAPLGAESIAAIASQAADLRAEQLERVVARAEGNALLALETARQLARGGAEEAAPGLRGSVRTALQPLSAEARELVEIAAVAARPIDTLELEATGLPDPEGAATEALQTGLLLASATSLAFRHALLRDAVCEEVAPPRRRGVHRRWARALLAAEERGAIARPAEVARQLRLAGDDREAVTQLARAAHEARSLAALAQACGYLREALGIAPEEAELWLELGELEAWRGHRPECEAAFDRGIELLADAAELTRARALLARSRAFHGPICLPRGVLESAGAALALLDGAGEEAGEERSEALAACAWAQAVAGDVEEAERLLARLSSDEHSAEDLRIYDIGHARALTLMRRGRFAESYGPSIAAGEAIARAGRPDLTYGCWANAASAATVAGEHDRALEFLDRGQAAIAGCGLQGVETHLLAARSFVLRGLGRLTDARAATVAEQELAERLGNPELLAMASHDRGLVALAGGEHAEAATLLAAALVEGAPISRPLTRLALAEALACAGDADGAAQELRAAVLEPIRPSDFPDALVPRLARVQGLIALARGDAGEARLRLQESVAGWERLLARTVQGETITSVLADLGRPVVGLVEPERELQRARADVAGIQTRTEGGRLDAVVP